MDTAQRSQEAYAGVAKPMEGTETAPSSCSSKGMTMMMMEKKIRPKRDEALNCPRCNSTNTKFCYYNNYSLTQPRYYCKTCRRYWTEGGSLRNVPVGGGSRKNKRISSSSSHKLPQDDDLNPPTLISNFSSHQNLKTTHQGRDLNLANFPAGMQHYLSISQYVEKPKIDIKNINHHNQYHSSSVSALELLRTSCRGLNSFVPTPMPNSGFLLQELKPNLSLPPADDHQGLIGSRYGNLHALVQENGTTGNGSRLIFPFGFGALNKQVPTTNNEQVDQHTNKGSRGNSTSSWNGMFGRGSW